MNGLENNLSENVTRQTRVYRDDTFETPEQLLQAMLFWSLYCLNQLTRTVIIGISKNTHIVQDANKFLEDMLLLLRPGLNLLARVIASYLIGTNRLRQLPQLLGEERQSNEWQIRIPAPTGLEVSQS